MPATLTEIAADVFSLETDLRLSAGFRLNARMVAVRCDGELWVHSPLPKDTDWYDAVEALGPVRWIVAPNLYHHLYLGDACARFPEALLAGPAALAKKRSDLELDWSLGGSTTPSQWPKNIALTEVGGAPGASEFLFYERNSRSLLTADLLFNNRRPSTFLARSFVRLTSGWKGPARSRIWRFLVKDKTAFASSLARLDSDVIDRVIPAHGDVVTDSSLAIELMRTGKATD